MSPAIRQLGWAALAASLFGALGASGCSTDAFCFSDCTGDAGVTTGTSTSSSGVGGLGLGGSDAGCLLNCGGGGASSSSSSTGAGGSCDTASPKSCGICSNDCTTLPTNWDPKSIACTPSKNPGVDPGTCTGTCAQDYWDTNKDPKDGCEYYCVLDPKDPNDATCDNLDQNCNGVKDEGVDVCSNAMNCGKCGGNCVVLHGTPACTNNGSKPCDPSNTQCGVAACDNNGPGDRWWDLDNSYATGCEYQCDLTNGGVEICDGIDNDCNGKIDGADPGMVDPAIGVVCYGGVKGECAKPAHAGMTACQGGLPVCIGPNVIVVNQVLETCNGLDDDCDGAVDNNPTDAGASCGVSNIFPCQFGTKQCVMGALVCIGELDPKPEVCNGADDDCDGMIDQTAGMPPMDSVGPCSVPPPPPAGATSPCKAGAKACVGGTIQCQGAVLPVSLTDTCKVDANCDGVLGSQPDLMTDVKNCGACGNDCLVGAVHSNWGCTAGVCKFLGCAAGYYDNGAAPDPVAGDNKCGYPCVFVSAQEACNGSDDNCDGQIDEAVVSPSPVQVCGVSPSASTPECTAGGPAGVTVKCMGGAWKCAFLTANVCSPTCAGATEICDSLDNNCNGIVNETFNNYNKPCASDDGKPPPGDGACRTTGLFACQANTSLQPVCNAAKNLAAAGPELCDKVDNDCDGLVDEPFTAKGSNSMYFVKPAVTKIAASTWIYQYEASRTTYDAVKNPLGASNVVPGSGNGYQTSAPPGVTLDKTTACSAPTTIPWFNVTPTEVEQTCTARGGHICSVASEWQTACKENPPGATTCTLGYAPYGAACNTPLGPPYAFPFVGGTFCNLGPTYDFDLGTGNDQDGLLVTGSASLKNCYSDWSTLLANGAIAGKIYDLTGNLHEVTKCRAAATACTVAADCCAGVCTAGACVGGVAAYPLMGGAFNTQDENGASCNFRFYTVDQTFQLYDVGFRCCFSADPTL